MTKIVETYTIEYEADEGKKVVFRRHENGVDIEVHLSPQKKSEALLTTIEAELLVEFISRTRLVV